MEKGIILWSAFFLFSFLFLANVFAIDVITGDSITGGVITGKATSQNTNVSIVITVPSANIIIIGPKNQTYLSNVSLLLNFLATGQQAVWYNFDHIGNTTITSFKYFNISSGSHTLYMFANNTDGDVTSKNVTFIINFSLFNFSYNSFNGEHKGNSTDLSQYSFQELQNLSNYNLEDTRFGKIFFIEPINITDDHNPGNGFIDIDKYVNITSNRIEIDSRYLGNFNKSATLTLYDLTLADPVITMDGVTCPTTICVEQSYSGGVLVFNVSHFTAYSAEEASSVQTSPSSGSSGGGGGSSVTSQPSKPKKPFSLDADRLEVSVRRGEVKSEAVIIKNIGTKNIKVNLTQIGLGNLIRIHEDYFELAAGQSKTILLDFIAREDSFPSLYLGKIIVSSEGIEEEILVAVNVNSKNALFDVIIEIPDNFLQIFPGEDVIANIKLFEIEKIGKIDVIIEYGIRDRGGNLITSEKETIAVEKQANFVKSLKTPDDVEDGDYLFYINVEYNGQIASASEWFSISRGGISGIQIQQYMVFMVLVVMMVIIIILFREIRNIRSSIKKPYKIDENILAREKLIKIKNLGSLRRMHGF